MCCPQQVSSAAYLGAYQSAASFEVVYLMLCWMVVKKVLEYWAWIEDRLELEPASEALEQVYSGCNLARKSLA
jgi:hypothetical protein